MKKTILSLMIASSFLFGCKKDDKVDSSAKTVTYTFVPNGASSQVIYQSVQLGTQINAGYKSTIFSVNDQVTVGSKTKLIMSTSRSVLPSGYEIRITYNGKNIGTANGSPNLALDKTFTSSDFK